MYHIIIFISYSYHILYTFYLCTSQHNSNYLQGCSIKPKRKSNVNHLNTVCIYGSRPATHSHHADHNGFNKFK